MKYFSPLFAAFWLRPKPGDEWIIQCRHDPNLLLEDTAKRHRPINFRHDAKKGKILRMASSDFPSMGPIQELSLMPFEKDTFQDSSLQMAVEIFNEAQTMAKNG